jgi:hypothetical protein
MVKPNYPLCISEFGNKFTTKVLLHTLKFQTEIQNITDTNGAILQVMIKANEVNP